MSGRRQAQVWMYYERDLTNPKNPKAKCKGCDTLMQGIPTRMTKHVQMCKGLREKGLYMDNTEEVTRGLKRKADDTHESDTSDTDCIDLELEERLPKKMKRSDCYVVKTSEDQLYQINLQLARAVASTASSFNFVENKQVRILFHMLRPGVELAGRKRVGGTLLDTIYDQEVEKAKTRMSGQTVTLAIDSWSTRTNDPL